MHKPTRLLAWAALAFCALGTVLWTARATASAPQVSQAEPALTIVEPLTISSLSPSAGKLVTATFAVRNDGAEPIFLLHLLAAGRPPGCVDFGCSEVEDFAVDADLTIAPGETYRYEAQRIFLPEGAYFFQLTYEVVATEWHFIGDRVDVNVGPGLRLTQPFVLTPADPAPGEPVLAQFELTNAGSAPIFIPRMVAGARGPNCVSADWSCESRPDHAYVDNLLLDPGESYAYSATRAYAQAGAYFVQAAFIDEAGEWQQIGERIDFVVAGVPVGTDLYSLYLPAVQR